MSGTIPLTAADLPNVRFSFGALCDLKASYLRLRPSLSSIRFMNEQRLRTGELTSALLNA